MSNKKPIDHDPRSDRMAELYRDGKKLTEIGDMFGLSRERVRQLISRFHGLRAADGGKHKQILIRQEQRRAEREAVCLATYGCSTENYRQVRCGPIRKFTKQKASAHARGIGWELTLWQWWTIWQESGKWEMRGRGQAYVMCRKGDIGPYAVGNVFIGLAANNSSEAKRKSSSLPVGVRKNKRYAGYSASRMVHGKMHRLGSFPTPDLARAAYLSLAPLVSVNRGNQ